MASSILESSKINKQTRRLCVEINGSMQQFAKSGHDAASWCPNNAKIGEILGVSDVFDNNPDVGTTAGCLQNAILHKVTLFEIKKFSSCAFVRSCSFNSCVKHFRNKLVDGFLVERKIVWISTIFSRLV